MATKQIQCPNCGATIQASQVMEVECPYCGSKFENPLNQREEATVIKKIIPFSLSEQDVKDIIFEEFINKDDVPKDIFDKLQLHPLKQYYLPMYLFRGQYRADWSCTVIYEQKDRQGNETKEYRPASGTATGNFFKLTLASYTKGNIPQMVRSYADVLEWTSELDSKISTFKASYLISEKGDAIEVIDPTITEKEAWNKSSLQDSIEKDAKDAAHSQTPNRVLENYRVTANWNGSKGELVLVPVWCGSYLYNGEEHFFAIDGRGTNFDYSYPHDSTDEVRGWKVVGRFFLMVGLLFAILASTANKLNLQAIIAILGAIVLTARFVLEYGKSSEDLTAIKQIGKAKLCNEDIPDVSSNYLRFKRTNQIAMWLLIAIIAAWGFGAKAIEENRLAQQQAQEQAQFEEARKMINQITPDLFFHKSESQIGHLRQDVVRQLTKMGFALDNSSNSTSNKEKYALCTPNGEVLVTISINAEIVSSYHNSNDKIKDVCIEIVDDRHKDAFIENFKSQLEEKGFSITSNPSSISRPSRPDGAYMRMGKEIEIKEMFYNRYVATWDAVKIWGNQIKCFSKDEIGADTSLIEESDVISSDTIFDGSDIESQEAIAEVEEEAPAE